MIDFVRELFKIDILLRLVFAQLAEYVDGESGKHGSELDVKSAAADSQTHLLRLQVHLGLLVLLVHVNARHLRRTQSALNKQLDVCRIVDYVDILVAQLSYDTMNTASADTHAGSHRVDALVVAFHRNLGTLARHTRDALDRNQTVVDFRHLGFEQALQEHRTCARKDNLRVVVLVVHAQDDRTHGLTLTILVRRNLLCLRQYHLVVLIVNEQHLALPDLINLARDNLSHAVLILVIQRVVFQFQNLRSQRLAQVQDSTAAKLGKFDRLRHILAHLIVMFNLLRLAQRDFLVLVLHLAICHNNTVAINLKVALVGIHDNIEVLVTTEDLGNYVTETLLQHAHKCSAVDILRILEFLHGLNHVRHESVFL